MLAGGRAAAVRAGTRTGTWRATRTTSGRYSVEGVDRDDEEGRPHSRAPSDDPPSSLPSPGVSKERLGVPEERRGSDSSSPRSPSPHASKGSGGSGAQPAIGEAGARGSKGGGSLQPSAAKAGSKNGALSVTLEEGPESDTGQDHDDTPRSEQLAIARSSASGHLTPEHLREKLAHAKSWLIAEEETQASCKSLPFTALFYMSFFMVQIAHRDVGTVYPLTSALTSTMRTGVVPSTQGEDVTARPAEGIGLALSDVRSWGGSLEFVERTVVPYLWAAEDGGPGIVMGVNQLIGGVRVQQWRVETIECVGAEALIESYSNFMSSRYNRSCRSAESAYETHGLAGSTRSGASSDEVVQGQYANADTDAYTYWILNQFEGQPSSMANALSHVEGLRENRWLSAATEAVTVEFAMYCGQVGYFALVQVEFSMDRVGAFTASVQSSTLQTKVWTWMTVLCDLWFVVNVAWLVGGEIFGLIAALKRNAVKEHFFQFYRLVNLALIFGGCVVIAFFIWLFMQIGDVGEELTSLLSTHVGQNDTQLYFASLDDAYDHVTWMTTAVRWNEMSAFWYSILMLVKFFQNFNANERLAVITRTLTMSSEDLFHFMIVFLLVYFNFIIGAHFLFGQVLKEWSSPILALCTGFRALMGDFDFLAMYYISPFNSTCWFVIYMGFIFLVLVNMLVAIVMEAYAEVKENAGKAESVFTLVMRNVDEFTIKHTGKRISRSRSTKNASAVQEQELTLDDLQMWIEKAQGGIDKLLDQGGPDRPTVAKAPVGVSSVQDDHAMRARGAVRAAVHPDSPAGARSAALAAARTPPRPLVLDGDTDVEWAPTCSCGFAFPSKAARFCGACGLRRACEPLAVECGSCGSRFRPGDHFCSVCGAARGMHGQSPAGGGARVRYDPLPVAAAGPPDVRSPPSGERFRSPPSGERSPASGASVFSDLRKEKKLAELQALMNRYGVAFNSNEAQKVLRRSQGEP